METIDKVSIVVTPEESPFIQLMLFSHGYGWNRGATKEVRNVNNSRLFLYVTSKDLTYGRECFVEEFVPTLTAEELSGFLSGSYVPPPLCKKFTVDEYDVTVFPGGSVKFGCTTIDKDDVKKIVEAWTVTAN